MDAIKILIVEDEMIIGAKISMQLAALGYEVSGILPRGEDAVVHAQENKPDIVLLDINLKGKIDGIETAIQLQQKGDVPIIYLTANADDATFNRAKATKPYAFIAKPFKQLDLQRAIELTISRMAENENGTVASAETDDEPTFILSDRIFVRQKEKMTKIMLADIQYIEADRNYSHIFSGDKEYILTVTLKAIEEKLSTKTFLRLHRSFIVNMAHVDEVTEEHVLIGQKKIPIGNGMKEVLLKNMKTL
ncbi:MAG: response regulator [Cyclobacteriaceae bacterium]|nr:response regulator [Cyclobacteriaceae bacterium]